MQVLNEDVTSFFSFPGVPYATQCVLIRAAYAVLRRSGGSVGIFEAPTGSGKTVAVLCAVVKFIREHSANITRLARITTHPSSSDASDAALPAFLRAHAASTQTANLIAKLLPPRFPSRRIAPTPHSAHLEPSIDDTDCSSTSSEEDVSKIRVVYSSRTHSQLQQVIDTIRRPPFSSCGTTLAPTSDANVESSPAPPVTAVVIAARRHLCINEAVLQAAAPAASLSSPPSAPSKLTPGASGDAAAAHSFAAGVGVASTVFRRPRVELDALRGQAVAASVDTQCRTLGSSCPHRDRTQVAACASAAAPVADLESLVDAGLATGGCPYYAARRSARRSDCIVVPYGSVVSRSARAALGVRSLANKVVVFDEAHHVPTATSTAFESVCDVVDFAVVAAALGATALDLATAAETTQQLATTSIVSSSATDRTNAPPPPVSKRRGHRGARGGECDGQVTASSALDDAGGDAAVPRTKPSTLQTPPSKSDDGEGSEGVTFDECNPPVFEVHRRAGAGSRRGAVGDSDSDSDVSDGSESDGDGGGAALRLVRSVTRSGRAAVTAALSDLRALKRDRRAAERSERAANKVLSDASRVQSQHYIRNAKVGDGAEGHGGARVRYGGPAAALRSACIRVLRLMTDRSAAAVAANARGCAIASSTAAVSTVGGGREGRGGPVEGGGRSSSGGVLRQIAQRAPQGATGSWAPTCRVWVDTLLRFEDAAQLGVPLRSRSERSATHTSKHSIRSAAATRMPLPDTSRRHDGVSDLAEALTWLNSSAGRRFEHASGVRTSIANVRAFLQSFLCDAPVRECLRICTEVGAVSGRVGGGAGEASTAKVPASLRGLVNDLWRGGVGCTVRVVAVSSAGIFRHAVGLGGGVTAPQHDASGGPSGEGRGVSGEDGEVGAVGGGGSGDRATGEATAQDGVDAWDRPLATLLVGGTLSPIVTYAAALGLPPPSVPEVPTIAQLKADGVEDGDSLCVAAALPSVVPPTNVSANVVGQLGVAGGVVRLRFTQREIAASGHSMFEAAAAAIVGVSSKVGGGVAVFASSGQLRTRLAGAVTSAAKGTVRVFEEPSVPSELDSVLQSYRDAAEGRSVGEGAGCVLVATMGGRLSEGVNLSDAACRVLFVVGVPVAPPDDYVAALRAAHAAPPRDAALRNAVDGTDPYHAAGLPATEVSARARQVIASGVEEVVSVRVVNQTVGRAVRHAKDYAALVFLDERYVDPNGIRRLVSSWALRSGVAMHGSADSVVSNVVRFLSERGCLCLAGPRSTPSQPSSTLCTSAASVRADALEGEGADRLIAPSSQGRVVFRRR